MYIGQSWLSYNGSSIIPRIMPSTISLFQTYLLLWTSIAPWSTSNPSKRASDCPGHTASNIKQTQNSVTADLTLAGSECNLHGQDLINLKFSADFQTGMSFQFLRCSMLEMKYLYKLFLMHPSTFGYGLHGTDPLHPHLIGP